MISVSIKQSQMLKIYNQEKGIIFFLNLCHNFPLKSIHIKWRGGQRNNNYF